MSNDDRYILEQIVSQEHQKNAPKLKVDEYFEVFSAEQILKMGAFDLDPEQIRSGIVARHSRTAASTLCTYSSTESLSVKIRTSRNSKASNWPLSFS